MSAAVEFPPFHGNLYAPEGRKVVIIGYTFCGLATIAVALRLYIRAFTKIGLGLDDLSIVVTLLMVWALSACATFMWHNGMGLHPMEVPLLNLSRYLQSLYAFELFYIADFGCCKVSILLFYQRVFSVTRARRNLVWGLLTFMVLFTVIFELIFVFQCSPLHWFWTRLSEPTSGKCMNNLILYGVYTGINIITDILIWLYPLPIVWKLQVGMSQKIGLAILFILGALVCIVSIIRATTIPKIVSLDFTYADIDAGIWALVECALCCIVACLPTLRVLFRRKKRGTTGYSGSGSGPKVSHPRPTGLSNGSVQSRSWFDSSAATKKWGKGIETTIDITQDPDPEDGFPLTNARNGWSRMEEETEGNPDNGVKKHGW